MSPQKPIASDRPLGQGQLGALAAGMVALLIGFYVFAFVTMAWISTLMLFDSMLLIALARFGFSGIMVPPIQRLARLFELICRCLNLRPPVFVHLPLRQEQAPQLFDCVAQIAQKMGVKAPDEIVVKMGATAWIRLQGYRTGAGRSTLCLGYDLLALLNQRELEAIIAHELAHAKLMQRGFKGWLGNGILRIDQQLSALQDLNASQREQNQTFYTAEILGFVIALFALGLVKLFAAYCRHDEFLADKIAAEICGADVCAHALLLTHLYSEKLSALTWRDYLVQIQRTDSFVEWIRRHGIPLMEEELRDLEQRAFSNEELDPHSLHPTMADRLAALSVASWPVGTSLPAIRWLQDPDHIARDVIATFERVARDEERRDSIQLRKWVRKEYRRTKTTAGELLGWFLGVIGVLGMLVGGSAFVSLAMRGSSVWEALSWLGMSTGLTALSVLIVRVSIQRERMLLPVPSFTRWQLTFSDPDDRPEERPMPLTSSVEGIRGRRALGQYWAEQCYQALAVCNYPTVSEAALGCLRSKSKRVEGQLGLAISAAYYLNQELMQIYIGYAIENYGAGPSVSWAMAWITLLLGDFAGAEPYLQDAVAYRPKESTLWALLAQSQARQEKNREALDSIREAVRLSPDELELRELLLEMLLDFGQIRDARTELRTLQARDSQSFVALIAAIRLPLLLGDRDEAARQAQTYQDLYPGHESLMQLAVLYRDVKDMDMMYHYLEKITELVYYPMFLIALAEREKELQHDEAARALYFAAMDRTRTPIYGISDIREIWRESLNPILSTRQPLMGCRSWRVSIDGTQVPVPGLGRMELDIKAPTHMDAQNFAFEFYNALYPGADAPQIEIAETAVTSSDMPTSPGVHRSWFV